MKHKKCWTVKIIVKNIITYTREISKYTKEEHDCTLVKDLVGKEVWCMRTSKSHNLIIIIISSILSAI